MSLACTCPSPSDPTSAVCGNCGGTPSAARGHVTAGPPPADRTFEFGRPVVSRPMPPDHRPAVVPPPVDGRQPLGAPLGVVTAKSPGLAVFLSIWLGGGHLYVGQIALGVGLLFLHFFLLLLLFTGIGAIVAIPVWLVAFALAATTSSNAAKEFNRRNGITVY